MNAGGQAPAETEGDAQQRDSGHQAEDAVVEEPSIPHIVRHVLRVFLDDGSIFGFFDVVEDVAELHGPEPFEVRTVRIAFFIREGMVLAVDGHPLAGTIPVVSQVARRNSHATAG